MSESSPQEVAALARLREAHRSETADPVLRRRVLERFAETGADLDVEVATWRWPWLRRVLWPSVLVLNVGLLVLALVWTARHTLEQRSPVEAPPPIALGPEPHGLDARDEVGAREAIGAESERAVADGPCPMSQVPSGAVIEPQASPVLQIAGVTIHTFFQDTPSCGPIERRYLLMVPPQLSARTRAPLLVVLHDTGQSAESTHVRQTYWHFENMAREFGLVLVYANGAPGRGTSLSVENSGGWRTDPGASSQIDDEDYLERIVRELAGKRVLAGNNDVYLAGLGSGAVMALTAAGHSPKQYTGVATFNSKDLRELSAIPAPSPGQRSTLARILIVERQQSQQNWLSPELQSIAENWAVSVGVGDLPLTPRRVELSLPEPAPSRLPRSFSVQRPGIYRWDIARQTSGGPAVRVLMLDSLTDPFPVERYTPGAFDGAREAWAFLSGADGIDPAPVRASTLPSTEELDELGADEAFQDGQLPPPPIQFLEEPVRPERVLPPGDVPLGKAVRPERVLPPGDVPLGEPRSPDDPGGLPRVLPVPLRPGGPSRPGPAPGDRTGD
jgi:hypothetical protein